MHEKQFTARRVLLPTVSSSLPWSLAQVRNSSYLWKGMTGSGSSLRYSLSREATVCTSVLLQRTNRGEKDGRPIEVIIYSGCKESGKTQIIMNTDDLWGQRRPKKGVM